MLVSAGVVGGKAGCAEAWVTVTGLPIALPFGLASGDRLTMIYDGAWKGISKRAAQRNPAILRGFL